MAFTFRWLSRIDDPQKVKGYIWGDFASFGDYNRAVYQEHIGTGLQSLPQGWFRDDDPAIQAEADQASSGNQTTTTGSNNAYTVNMGLPPEGYYVGLSLHFIANETNTGPVVMGLGQLSPKSVSKNGGYMLTANDIVQGRAYLVIYNGATWDLQAPLKTTDAKRYGVGNGLGSDSLALQAAIDADTTGVVELPDGPIVYDAETVWWKPGTAMLGTGNGGQYSALASGAVPQLPTSGTRIIIKSSSFFPNSSGFPRIVRSKGIYRGAAGDANDPPLSCAFNIQHNSFTSSGVSITLDFDPLNTDPLHESTVELDCIFLSSRVKAHFVNTHIIGHAKVKSILCDVTRNNPWAQRTLSAVTVNSVSIPSNSARPGEYLNCWVEMVSGPARGEKRRISATTTSTTFTLSGSWINQPLAGDRCIIHGREWVLPGSHPTKPGFELPSTPERGGDGFTFSHGCLIWGARAGIKTLGAQPKAGLPWYGRATITQATVQFGGIPADGDTLSLAEITWTFRNNPNSTYAVQIGGTVEETIKNLEDACVELVTSELAPKNFDRATYYAFADKLLMFSRYDDDAMAGYVLAKAAAVITLPNTNFITIADPGPYFDPVTGVLTGDNRGSFGFSDFYFDGEIIQDHPSGQRRGDPTYPLSADTVLADQMQFAIDLDGMAGNTSTSIHRAFIGANARIMVMEGGIRLGRHSRMMVDNAHFEYSRTVKTAKGIPVETNFNGTVVSATSGTLTLPGTLTNMPAAAYAINNSLQFATVTIAGGAGVLGEERVIAGWNATNKVATLESAFSVTPDNTTTVTVRMFLSRITYRHIACQRGMQYVAPRMTRVDMTPDERFLPVNSRAYANTENNTGRNVWGGDGWFKGRFKVGKDITGAEGNRMVGYGGKDAGYFRYSYGTRETDFASYMMYTYATKRWQLNIGGIAGGTTFAVIQATEGSTFTDIDFSPRLSTNNLNVYFGGLVNRLDAGSGSFDYRALSHLFRSGTFSRFEITETKLTASVPIDHQSYATASLPSAAALGRSCQAFCTDIDAGVGAMVFTDASGNWRKVADNTVVVNN